ncbi:interferon alpha/beta receptor 2-like [Aquarana catesbeiana]|uniref:interferon alpha/beta receptor 2-like n=1 Tax=Aquarana catesbeiana TaxID=8400 RepID=UPI003CC94B23
MMVHLQCLLQLCHLPLLAVGILLPPRNLNIRSRNFKHILRWEEPNAESDIFYNVLYQIKYGLFLPADNCSNITTRQCDLTKVFSGIWNPYSAQVQSFTSTERSDPSPPTPIFRPVTHTVVGPPIVDVVAAGSGINVSISLPISYLWNNKKKTFDSILTAYPAIDYKIELDSPTKEPIQVDRQAIPVESFTISIPSLYPSTTYCVTVSMDSENMDLSVPSPKKCVITEGSRVEGDNKVFWIAAGVILFIILLLLLIFLDQTGYISKKKILAPKVLASLPDSRSLFHRPDQLSPLCLTIYTEDLQNLENEQIYENPATMGNAPYLANNLNAENEDQQAALNQDNSLSSNEAPTREHSGGALQDLTEIKLLEGSDVPVMMSMGDTWHPAVIPLSESSMEASSEDVFGSSGILLSNLANGFDDSLNLSLIDNPFSIDLNSVSLGDSADLWTGVPMVASPKNLSNVLASHPNGDVVNMNQFTLLCSVHDTDTPAMDNLPCENDEDGDIGSDLNCAPDYIRR